MLLQASVILSLNGGGGGGGEVWPCRICQHTLGHPPPWTTPTPPPPQTTPATPTLDNTHPSPGREQGNMVNGRAVRILLECILVYLHATPVYPSPGNSVCYVMITVDRGSTSRIRILRRCEDYKWSSTWSFLFVTDWIRKRFHKNSVPTYHILLVFYLD